MTDLPISARLAWWGTSWLNGLIGPDELLDGVLGDASDDDRDTAHVVLDADRDGGAEGGEPLLLALAAARRDGATGVAAVFPAAGDPQGLRGSRDLAAAAVDAGEAVLVLGVDRALVPRRAGRVVEWSAYPSERRPPPDVGEADRALRAALLIGARELADLDVVSWRPEIADELQDLRAGRVLSAPPGVPVRCVEVAGRALHLEAVVTLALADDSAVVSVTEGAARRAALLPLERAARHALTAACSPDGWPPPG